jgi:hypothetical protein
MGMVALCNHQMMFLMMHPVGHDADEPKRLQFLEVLGRRGHRQGCAAFRFGRTDLPAANTIHDCSVRTDHPLDRSSDRTVTGDRKSDPTFDRRALHLGVQGHVVHVDQMLPQSADIHFAPVSARVSLQNLDDFLDGRERALARLRRCGCRTLVGVRTCVVVMAGLGVTVSGR